MAPGPRFAARPKPSGRAHADSFHRSGRAAGALGREPGPGADRLRPPRRRLHDLPNPQRRPGDLRRALRARRALPGLELLLSAHRERARHLLAEEPGDAARGGQMLRVRRARRRRDRAAARAGRISRSTASAATIAISRPRPIPRAPPATPPASATSAAAPGPICGPAYGGPAARCYLKDKITRPHHKPCCISGVVR